MKIPAPLIEALLLESPSFRKHVANIMEGNIVSQEIRNAVLSADGKIDAIKKVRAIFDTDPSHFLVCFPSAEVFGSGLELRLGLGWSKKLVESLRDFN